MFKITAIRVAALALALSAFSQMAQAVPISGLFTTGVDNLGNVLGDGAQDTHYAILSPAQQAVVINQASIPGTWVPNNSTSRWVWQQANGQPTNVTLTFRTTFDLTGLDPLSAIINGTWSTDNSGLDILINGTSTGQTCGGFTSFCNFALTSGFSAGLNTLDFVVRDVGVISGFRVGSISGTANPRQVPEPGLPALLGAALCGWILVRRAHSRPAPIRRRA